MNDYDDVLLYNRLRKEIQLHAIITSSEMSHIPTASNSSNSSSSSKFSNSSLVALGVVVLASACLLLLAIYYCIINGFVLMLLLFCASYLTNARVGVGRPNLSNTKK